MIPWSRQTPGMKAAKPKKKAEKRPQVWTTKQVDRLLSRISFAAAALGFAAAAISFVVLSLVLPPQFTA